MVCSKKLRSSLAFSSGELSLKLQACFYLVCISNLSTLKSASKWPLAIQSGTVTPWNSRIYIFCNMQSLPFCLYSQTGLFQIPKFSNVAKCLLICRKKFWQKRTWNFFCDNLSSSSISCRNANWLLFGDSPKNSCTTTHWKLKMEKYL